MRSHPPLGAVKRAQISHVPDDHHLTAVPSLFKHLDLIDRVIKPDLFTIAGTMV